MKVKNFKAVFILTGLMLAAGVLFVPCTKADAAVTFSTSSEPDDDKIGITGNPDFYPYEYYNEKTGEYEGVFPEIYDLISVQTGLDFEYINCGPSDQRLVDQKTGYAQIISAYVKNEKEMSDYLMTDPVTVVSYDDDGSTVDICFAFGKYADQEVIDQVSAAMENISDEEINSLLGKYINAQSTGTDNAVFFVIIAVLVLLIGCAGAALAVMIIKSRKNNVLLQKKEFQDKLTGIGNKKYFEEEFRKLVAYQYKASYVMAYIAFDIQRVNKYYGEEKAEEQLCYAAGILGSNDNKNEIAARVAGGAFGIMHISGTPEEAAAWAQSLIAKLNVYSSQFDKDYAPKFKAGVYWMPSGNWDFNRTVKNAMRCYETAVKRDQDFFVSDEAMEQRNKMNEVLSHEINQALEERQIVQYLQPIVSTEGEKIIGAEGLARWNHPTMGLLMPGRFIQMMIDEGKIIELDMYLFEESCRKLEQWKREGKNYRLSTNFTRMSITSEDLINRISTAAGKYSFDRENLIVEITEDSLENNRQIAMKNMQEVKKLGFRLALDDLGTGFTFFSDLKDYPLDVIKMDREMLLGAADEKGRTIMEGLIRVCKDIDMEIICEGIETREQYEMVKKMGCDYIQGFYFFHPISPEEAARFI